MSLPSRKRGLKYYMDCFICFSFKVASLAEAWIEIFLLSFPFTKSIVASLAEAWIEMDCNLCRLHVCICRFPRGSVD